MAKRYRATSADTKFRDMTKVRPRDPFELAIQMQFVSREYLLVLASENLGDDSSLRYLIEAELRRRDLRPSSFANWIALASAVIALASMAFAIVK